MINSHDDLIQVAHNDPRYIIERGLYVVNKSKAIVPFIFNEPQNIFYEDRSTRDDLLKAGQLGISTMILAILGIKFLLIPNAWCVCISHQEEATQRLFERVDFFLKHLPPWLAQYYTPGKTTEGDIVNTQTNSKFYIGTAGARAFGRGDTIHYAHLSESSRWRDSGRVMTGVIRAVPLDDPKTWIVKETTANGQGNLHHQEYKRAQEGRSEFKAHFLPWFSNPDYQIHDHTLSYSSIRDDMKSLVRRFPEKEKQKNKGFVSLSSIAWYLKMEGNLVSEDGRTPTEMMKQEFPSDVDEAFLFSGNPIFPAQELKDYIEKIPDMIMRCNIEGISPHVNLDETNKGYIRIFKKPSINSQYVIFADVSEGGDACSAHVIGKKSGRIVATFHAFIDSDHFGSQLNKLGRYYNNAEIAVEVNNMGIATIQRLRDLEYPHLYMREVLHEKDKKKTMEYGWRTDKKTKPLIIANMQNLLRTGEIPYIDAETISEMTTYVRMDDGSMGASAGNRDDRVISICGAYYILKLHPYIEPIKALNIPVANKVAKFKKFRHTSVHGKLNRHSTSKYTSGAK